MARLIYTDSAGVRQVVPVGAARPVVTVGRNPDCDIVTSNPSVSRQHGEVHYRGGVFYVVDRNSSNGSTVNDIPVKARPIVLQHGDVIRCGDFEIRFEDTGAEDSQVASPAWPRRPVRPGSELLETHRGSGDGAAAVEVVSEAPYLSGKAQGLPSGEEVRRQPRIRPRTPPGGVGEDGLAVPPSATTGLPAGTTPGTRPAVTGTPGSEEVGDYVPARPREDVAAAEVLREELVALREAKTRLEAVKENLEIKLEQLQKDLLDREKRIGDLESKVNRYNMEIENHLEKQLALKQQLAHQAEQIADLREQLSERDHEVENLQYQIKDLKQQLDEGSRETGEKADEIAELKAKLHQKERLAEELQKQLDITSYDFKAAQEQLQHLSKTFSGAGGKAAELEQKLAHLREIVNDKEGVIEELRAELKARDEEIALYREGESGAWVKERAELREKARQAERLEAEVQELKARLDQAERSVARGPGGDAAQVNDLKRKNRALRQELEEVRAQLAELESHSGGGEEALRREVRRLLDENRLLEERIAKMSRLRAAGPTVPGGAAPEADPEALQAARNEAETLREENRELRRALREAEERLAARESTARPAAGEDGRDSEAILELKREIRNLRRERDTLREELDRARAGKGAPASADARLLESFRTLHQAVNDVVSRLVTDMDVARSYVGEIRELVNAFVRTDLSPLDPGDRKKLEALVRQVAPAETLESLDEAVGNSLASSEELKKELRKYREVLRS